MRISLKNIDQALRAEFYNSLRELLIEELQKIPLDNTYQDEATRHLAQTQRRRMDSMLAQITSSKLLDINADGLPQTLVGHINRLVQNMQQKQRDVEQARLERALAVHQEKLAAKRSTQESE